MGFPEWIPLDTWLPQVFQPEGLCGEVVWTLLGQSMAVWSLALFVFCLLVRTTIGQRRTVPARPPLSTTQESLP